MEISDDQLEEKWTMLREIDHFEHENIIAFLQGNPDPRSVPHIRGAIELKPKLAYLDYDDYGAYYKKCFWALQEIGTSDALQLIQECSRSDIPELKEQAQYRLGRLNTIEVKGLKSRDGSTGISTFK